MRNHLRLETALPMIAALVAAGCRSPSGEPDASTKAPPSLRPSETQICRGFGDKLLEGVTVAPARGRADYLELREEPASSATSPLADTGDGGVSSAPTILGKAGVACARAIDKPTCEAARLRIRSGRGFASHATGSGMAPVMRVTYLVANFGDAFEVITTEGELRRLLAPIDTTDDLELVAGCGRMLKTPSGWEVTKVYTDPGDCWGGSSGWQRFVVSVDGVVSLRDDHVLHRPPTCISGRRPDGLVAGASGGARGSLAEFFAESAYLEAASVVAFDRLADELTTLGAPVELVARARQSRDDETRHADLMEGFVRRLGGTPRALQIEPMRPRTAFATALENAVEGCIRETFGALVGHYQATAAKSAEVRDAMRSIAEDETSHASLAWDVAAWLEPRLSKDERRELDGARARAFRDLSVALERDPSRELTSTAGVPGAREAEQLLAALASTLAPVGDA